MIALQLRLFFIDLHFTLYLQDIYGIQEIVLDAELTNIKYVDVADSNHNEISIVKTSYEGYTYSVWIKLDDQVSEIKVTIKYEGQVGNAGEPGVFLSETE